ncbi:unnamed protein product [Meganyctiphanes norvegica]|uniref:Aldose 1-epimerase n=1 Tax=Meganyctiphanes norvegica TaxID=48144 RepID=A0AAV2RUK7_MEGNR
MTTIKQDVFGEFQDPDTGVKHEVKRFTLTSLSGVEVEVISYGAGIRGIKAPDKRGNIEYVTLGFDKFEEYKKFPFIGSSIGRNGNRIGKGKFHLDGVDYQLTINNNENHLHGGKRGWDKYNWESARIDNAVVFSLLSPDGDQGYPGSVISQVKYTLSHSGELRIDFEAMTTRATPINMTNHAFLNLGGHSSGRKSLLEHVFTVNADCYIPVSETLIPTGEKASVGGTAFDLRCPTTLGEALEKAPGGGFDHTFCLHNKTRGKLEFALRACHPSSGRVLEVYTSEPGVQIYTGNFLPKEKGKMVGYNGHSYTYQGSFCTEPQNFPDAINQPKNFPDNVLRPGKTYSHSMSYNFLVEK